MKEIRFFKYHGLGNDYLVLDPEDCPSIGDRHWICAVCHRNYGLGSDGILYGPLKDAEADFGLRIFNPDGSEAEKSGNGLRIFARYLFDHGRVREDRVFTVGTPGGVVECVVEDSGQKITVEMGRVSFDADVIPVREHVGEVVDRRIEIGNVEYRFSAATIGNPHCVLLMDDVSQKLANELGPVLENHPWFPNRTNVQLMKVLDAHRIQIEIWERGAGYTLASGSSSSAAGAVAKRLGLVESPVTVVMPGGEIALEISDHFHIRMSGPATPVATMMWSPEALKAALVS